MVVQHHELSADRIQGKLNTLLISDKQNYFQKFLKGFDTLPIHFTVVIVDALHKIVPRLLLDIFGPSHPFSQNL